MKSILWSGRSHNFTNYDLFAIKSKNPRELIFIIFKPRDRMNSESKKIEKVERSFKFSFFNKVFLIFRKNIFFNFGLFAC